MPCRVVVVDSDTELAAALRSSLDVAVDTATPATLGALLADEGPVLVVAHAGLLGSGLAAGADAALVPPLAPGVTDALLAQVEPDAADGGEALLRALFPLTLLGGDGQRAVAGLVDELASAFDVSCAILWGRDGEHLWHASSRPIDGDGTGGFELAANLERCRLALATGAPLIVGPSAPPASGTTLLAVALDPPGADTVGVLCLVDDRPRLFSRAEKDALALLADRLAVELSWTAAHERLAHDQDALSGAALVDGLTGAWTRPAFEQALARAASFARRRGDALCVAVFDVVRMRQINEEHGHRVGDRALAHVADLLRTSIRGQDAVGRVGGDQLAALLVGANRTDAEAVARKLATAIEASPMPAEAPLTVRVRAGVAALSDDDDDGTAMLARAIGAARAGDARGGPAADEPASDEPVELAAGSIVGGMYRILHEISSGAMGVVYRAEDLGLSRPVALKVLRADLARDAALVARFRGEAAMLAQLRQRNLVQVYSSGQGAGVVYFVMELVEGQPLSQVLGGPGAGGIDVEAIAQIVQEIGDALDAIASIGLIHRDVKPANILLDHINDRAVLVDVGVAKRREDRGLAAGTPGFAAPESFTDELETTATDVYGLAATAYTMLTGRTPFGSGTLMEVLRRQLDDEPVPPSRRRPGLSEAVDRVILKALAPAQGARYGSAVDFAVALASALRRAGQTQPVAVAGDVATAGTEILGGAVPRPPTMLDRAVDGAAPTHHVPRPARIRGAFVRVARRVLEHHLGASWTRTVIQKHPRLAAMLRGNVATGGWHPLAELLALLDTAPPERLDGERAARAIGRSTAAATLAHYLGAEPRAAGPAQVMEALPSFWDRYHDWCTVAVELTAEDAQVAARVTALVTVDRPPTDARVCALIGGQLGRSAELAGANEVRVTHPACGADADADADADAGAGASPCRFEIRWRP